MLVGKQYSSLSRAYIQKPRAVMLEGSFGFTRRTGNSGMQVKPVELDVGDLRIQFHITIGMISHRIHVSFHEICFKNVGLGIFRRRFVDLECWLGKYSIIPSKGTSNLPTFHPSPVLFFQVTPRRCQRRGGAVHGARGALGAGSQLKERPQGTMGTEFGYVPLEVSINFFRISGL